MSRKEQEDYRKAMLQKPQHQSVSEDFVIYDLIDDYKNQQIQNALSGLSSNYHRFRKIRGDGNCFFRAVAFDYLVRRGKVEFHEAFDKIDQVKLDIINKIPGTTGNLIQKNTQRSTAYVRDAKYINIKQDHQLKYCFQKAWKQYFIPLFEKTNNYATSLMTIMNNHDFVDMAIVLYFRAVCIVYFETHKQEYQIFYESKNQFYNVEMKLRTYGEESEGFIIKCISDAFQCKLIFSQVDNKNFYNTYDTMPNQTPKTKLIEISLFFKPGHYDILCGNVQQEEMKQVFGRDKLKKSEKNQQNQPNIQYKKEMKIRKMQEESLTQDKKQNPPEPIPQQNQIIQNQCQPSNVNQQQRNQNKCQSCYFLSQQGFQTCFAHKYINHRLNIFKIDNGNVVFFDFPQMNSISSRI